jgi:CTP synthase (UTP-ammonia lyase)
MAAQTFIRLTIGQIACRLLVSKPVEPATKEKISMFCHVATEQVIGVHDLVSVYHVPLLLQSQGLVPYLQKRLDLSSVNITSAMTDKGLALEKKWREVTEYVPLLLVSNLLLTYDVQRGALLRDGLDCPSWQIHVDAGLVYVRSESSRTCRFPMPEEASSSSELASLS